MAPKSLKQKDVAKKSKPTKRVTKKRPVPLLQAVGDEAFGFRVREISGDKPRKILENRRSAGF